MKLIHVVAGRSSGFPVRRHPSPDLILHHEHPQLFQLLAKFLDVVADKPVIDVHVGAVVEKVQRSLDIMLVYDKEAINKTIGRKPRYSAKTGVNKPHSNTVCAIVLL